MEAVAELVVMAMRWFHRVKVHGGSGVRNGYLFGGCLGLWITGGLLPAVAETQTFDSQSAATSAGWTASQTTVDGNSFGFSNTDNTGGSSPAGEAGGILSRSAVPAYYADTTIGGSYNRSTPFAASGELGVTIISRSPAYNGSVFIGYLNTTETNLNAFDGSLGINLAEESSSSLRFQAAISFPDGTFLTGNQLVITNILNSPRLWSFTFNPTGGQGFGELSVTIDGSGGGTSVLDLTAAQAGENFSLNAFGLSDPQTTNADSQNLTQLYIDNLNYATPEPGSLALCAIAVPGLLLRRRRKA